MIAKPAVELPTGAAAERRPLTTITDGARRAGPTLIRGWSAMHFAGFAALLMISVVCAAIVYRELTQAGPTPIVGSGEAPAALAVPPTPAEGTFVMPPLDTYREVTARPLFSATRRPAATASHAAAPMASFALAGVVISSDGRVALIRQGKTPGLIRVKEGQQIEGWTVRSIAADRVVVSNGAADAEIGRASCRVRV